MRYQVPQFIEVEDKIFGPLTWKQFVYIAGGIGASIALYLFLPFYISIIPIILILALAATLAFYKINNRPFINALESYFLYIIHPKLYIWHKEEHLLNIPKQSEEISTNEFIPKLTNSKLKDLAWTLDVREADNPVTAGDKTNTR